jgi:hypothetical protein
MARMKQPTIDSLIFENKSLQAIDGRAPGISLHSTLSELESQLNPHVRKILWAAAARNLDLPVDKDIQRANIILVDNMHHYCRGATNNKDASTTRITLAGYQMLARHHNRLVELQEELMYRQLPFPSTEQVVESELSQNHPAIRLTTAACKILGEEMDRIQGILYQARLSLRLQQQQRRKQAS